MVAIPFPTSSSPGLDQQESAGRLINAYSEKTDQGSPNQVIWRRAPGLSQLVETLSHTHCRGMIQVGSTVVVTFDDRTYSLTESGGLFTLTDLGAFDGTGPITMASNNASTPDIVAVDPDVGCLNLFIDSDPTDFADGDLPASPLSVSVLDGYFLWVFGDGTIYASDVNAVTVSTNSFTVADRRPGGLLRGVAYRGEFFAFGPSGCEVYRDAGATPFPLEFVTMIPRGIIGTNAVAGWEEGWSNELIWVGDDNIVYKLDGYSGTRISHHSVERAIQNSADRSAILMFVAMSAGHAFLFIKSPGEWTWIYDLTTDEWHERMSYETPDCRASCSVRAFGKWIVGDETTGKLGEFTEASYLEFDDPLVWKVQSGVPATFPSRGIVPRVDFDFTTGTGIASGDDPIQTDPVVLIRTSKDGGGTWGNPVERHLGAQGKRDTQVSIKGGCGMFRAQGIRFELEVSDPVHCALRGGQMAVQALA